MRKPFWQISATLDGFMEGPDRELDDTAQVADKDFDRYASEMLRSIGVPKIVFSKTLQKVEWNNSRLVKGNAAEEVDSLKRQPGKDLAVFGSADFAATLMQLGLIDEYRVLVTPVILGTGRPMFKHKKKKVALRLLKATTMSTGIVALNYEPTWAT